MLWQPTVDVTYSYSTVQVSNFLTLFSRAVEDCGWGRILGLANLTQTEIFTQTNIRQNAVGSRRSGL